MHGPSVFCIWKYSKPLILLLQGACVTLRTLIPTDSFWLSGAINCQKNLAKVHFEPFHPFGQLNKKKSRCCSCSMQMSPSVSSPCGSSVFVDAAKVIHKQCLLLGNCDFKYRITVLTRARFGFVKSHQGKILNGPHPSNSVHSFVLIFLPAIILICVVPVWSDEEFFRPVQLAKNDWRTEGESVGRFYFEGEC